ncbi:thiamine pyrophosphate-dependent enzyme [Rhodovulum sp. DZ06]|uniref:thiamine pyrophosphate-dependent enzyme n=1 Tax=Rhodovulum sp. DZ06 TaxID=3425126 RepID=UPI003D329A4E
MARAADLLADCLVRLGFDRMFCVPGESYLALLDALHERGDIETVVCRHEGGAGMMAVADAKITGRPGLAAVSRGPGATNASIAIHAAQQDAAPFLLLVGQVARFEKHRGAFQEVDYTSFFGGMAKGVWEIEDAGRIPETLSRAWSVAMSGTPGPVVVSLPEDMLEDMTDAPALGAPALPRAAAAPADLDAAAELVAKAERPLIIAGHGCASPEGRAALARAAEALNAPVALTFKWQHIFDNASPLFGGHLGFKIPKVQVDAMKKADLVLAVGTRLGDTPTQGYTFPEAPVPQQPLIHVLPDPGALGRVHHATLPVAADPALFLSALAERNLPIAAGRADWAAEINGIAKAIGDRPPQPREDGLEFGAMVQALAKHAPKGTDITLDAGNFSAWAHCLWPFDGDTHCLGMAGGAMGHAVPGAVAACLRREDKRAVAFVGDGGVLMTGNELATALATGAKPIVVISNNGIYATIRMHQERDYPARVNGTDLVNPDFKAWGEAFGALSFKVTTDAEAEEAAAAAFAHDGPVVIEVLSSAEAISPHITITKLREAQGFQ